jgi:hypothetical protein
MHVHQYIVHISSTDERDDAADRIGASIFQRLHNAFGDAVRVAHLCVEEIQNPEGAPE